MERNKKTWFILMVIALIATSLAGCGNVNNEAGTDGIAPEQPNKGNTDNASQTPKLEKTDIIVGLSLEVATYAPIYLADTNGYFEEEGLNVTVTQFQGDAGVIQALAGSSVDINVASMTGLVNAIKADQPFIAFWGGFNFADFGWYSPSLTSMEEANGKRIGVTTFGSLTDSLTRYAIKKAGLVPEKDVGIVAIGAPHTAIPALESGQIHSYIFPSPFNYVVEDMGMNLILSQREEIVPNYPTHVIYAHKQFVADNPESIKAFLRAVVRGMEFIEANPEETADYLVEHLKYEKEHAVKTVETLMPDWDKEGNIEQRGLDFFWELTIDTGVVDEAWDDEKWFDKSFMK